MHTLINLLRQLGFAINWSKVEGPSQQLVFLGVVVDSASMTLALPTLKLKDFSDLLTMFLKKKRVSVRQLETLVGKLSWASQVICGGRTFLRRVLDLKNSVKERHHKVLLIKAFFADLNGKRNETENEMKASKEKKYMNFGDTTAYKEIKQNLDF